MPVHEQLVKVILRHYKLFSVIVLASNVCVYSSRTSRYEEG